MYGTCKLLCSALTNWVAILAPSTTLISSGNSGEVDFWASETGASEQYLWVKACSDVHVYLTRFLQNRVAQFYKLVVGGADNVQTMLYRENTQVKSNTLKI